MGKCHLDRRTLALTNRTEYISQRRVELPVVAEDDMSIEDANESTEPLKGRLGAPAQRRHRL